MADATRTASPCTGVCTLDRAGLCRGCARTLDEIAGWQAMSASQRRTIMAALPARHADVSGVRPS
jgi:predicted Fe-S protein YdhL (DUF1289 family)